MTSKDIIIKLIDNKAITGEEAYVLLNDILKGEMVAVNEMLKPKTPNNGYIWTTSPSITYATADTAGVSCGTAYNVQSNG